MAARDNNERKAEEGTEQQTGDEVVIDSNRLSRYLKREEEQRWRYETQNGFGQVDSPLVYAELDAISKNLTGRVFTTPVDARGIPLHFTIETGEDITVGGYIHLSAEQAEGLAVDLLEQVQALEEFEDE